MYKLQISDDDGNITSIPVQNLAEEPVTIGRDEGNSIRLTERNISRKHATLLLEDELIILEDHSRYGMKVNGRKIAGRAILDIDDTITVGDYEVKLGLEGDALADSPTLTNIDGAPGSEVEGLSAGDTATDSTSVVELPRLVVLSRPMAGNELRLKSPEASIGRTLDNDLVLNHRSISRQHARLVWDGDQCSIIDMDSANGTKVSGQRFDRTILKRGDMVELGHVTLRYVEAGEPFHMDPGMIVDIQEGGAPRGAWLLAGLVAAAVGLGLLYAFYYAPPTPQPPEMARKAAVEPVDQGDDSAKGNTQRGQAAAQAAGAPPDGAIPEDELAGLVQEANGHLHAERWDEAIIAYGKVLMRDGTNQTARDGQTRAIHEQAAGRAYGSVNDLVVAGDYRGAWEQVGTLDGIPAESVYNRRARVLKKAIVASHIASLLDDGYTELRKRRYGQAAQVAETILKIDPDNRAATSLLSQSNAAAATARKKAREERASDGEDEGIAADDPEETERQKAPTPTKNEAANPSGAKTGKDIYKLARQMHNQDPDKAATLYTKAAKKGYARAWRQLGSLHLQQNRKQKAIQAYKKYLDLMPGAADAEVIRTSIQRLGGTP